MFTHQKSLAVVQDEYKNDKCMEWYTFFYIKQLEIILSENMELILQYPIFLYPVIK